MEEIEKDIISINVDTGACTNKTKINEIIRNI